MSPTTRPWGCPKCGGTDSKVHATATDADGVPVRWRDCTRPGCDGRWGSEERQINMQAFHARRRTDYDARMRRYRALVAICTFCERPYRRGNYMYHCRHDGHKAALQHPRSERDRRRDRERHAERYWERRLSA